MTTDPTRMLQLLEPAVRPGAAMPGTQSPQGKAPFESRSFQDLLKDVSKDSGESKDQQATAQKESNPLAGLGGLGQIENVALRRVLSDAQQAQAAG